MYFYVGRGAQGGLGRFGGPGPRQPFMGDRPPGPRPWFDGPAGSQNPFLNPTQNPFTGNPFVSNSANDHPFDIGGVGVGGPEAGAHGGVNDREFFGSENQFQNRRGGGPGPPGGSGGWGRDEMGRDGPGHWGRGRPPFGGRGGRGGRGGGPNNWREEGRDDLMEFRGGFRGGRGGPRGRGRDWERGDRNDRGDRDFGGGRDRNSSEHGRGDWDRGRDRDRDRDRDWDRDRDRDRDNSRRRRSESKESQGFNRGERSRAGPGSRSSSDRTPSGIQHHRDKDTVLEPKHAIVEGDWDESWENDTANQSVNANENEDHVHPVPDDGNWDKNEEDRHEQNETFDRKPSREGKEQNESGHTEDKEPEREELNDSYEEPHHHHHPEPDQEADQVDQQYNENEPDPNYEDSNYVEETPNFHEDEDRNESIGIGTDKQYSFERKGQDESYENNSIETNEAYSENDSVGNNHCSQSVVTEDLSQGEDRNEPLEHNSSGPLNGNTCSSSDTNNITAESESVT